MAVQYYPPPSSRQDACGKDPEDGFYVEVPFLPEQGDGGFETQGKDAAPRRIQHEGTTFLRTCFNGLNALSGVGILSIPYALSEGGWWSLTLLLMIAIMCCHTGLLLQRCMSAASHIRSYPDIGELAFGYRGRLAVSLFMYMELYLVAVEFLILEGDNLDNLFPNTSIELGGLKVEGKRLFTLLAALAFLPTTWLSNLGVLAFVSAGGVLASVLVVVSVLCVGAFEGVGFRGRGSIPINFGGLPTALGLYSFCYCGHAVFPTLCTSMKNKTQFPKVLLICFLLCTLNYGSMAVFGYLMYGQELKSQITLNLPKESVGAKVAILTTLINPFAKYALTMHPMAAAIEDRFLLNRAGSISFLTRTSLVASNLLIALAVPFFGYLMALIGSCLGIIVCVLLPCLCYLKIFGISQMSGLELAVIIGIMVAGVCIAITGTCTSLNQIVHNL